LFRFSTSASSRVPHLQTNVFDISPSPNVTLPKSDPPTPRLLFPDVTSCFPCASQGESFPLLTIPSQSFLRPLSPRKFFYAVFPPHFLISPTLPSCSTLLGKIPPLHFSSSLSRRAHHTHPLAPLCLTNPLYPTRPHVPILLGEGFPRCLISPYPGNPRDLMLFFPPSLVRNVSCKKNSPKRFASFTISPLFVKFQSTFRCVTFQIPLRRVRPIVLESICYHKDRFFLRYLYGLIYSRRVPPRVPFNCSRIDDSPSDFLSMPLPVR